MISYGNIKKAAVFQNMKKLQPVYEARSAGRPKRSEKNEKTGKMRYNRNVCFLIDDNDADEKSDK